MGIFVTCKVILYISSDFRISGSIKLGFLEVVKRSWELPARANSVASIIRAKQEL
jgi:hypothetical protein